jgi:hypothetical protein
VGNDQPGRTIRAGYENLNFHSHIILNKERKNLFIFDPFKSTLFPLLAEDRSNPNEEIVDFIALPYMHVISISRSGMLCLHSYEINNPNSSRIISMAKIDLTLGEDCYSMTICPLFTYIAVCVVDVFKQCTTRMFMARVVPHPMIKLQIITSLKMKEGVVTPPLNLIFYDYYERNILFTGVSNSKPTSVLSFIYESGNCKISEFMTRSVIPDMGNISRLSRIEDTNCNVGKGLESKDLLL